MEMLRINCSKNGRAELLALLTESHVEFSDQSLPFKGIFAAAPAIEIILSLGKPTIYTIAYVIGKWLAGNASRRIIIQMEDRQIVHLDARGYSIEEIKDVLLNTSSISAIQTKPDKESQP